MRRFAPEPQSTHGRLWRCGQGFQPSHSRFGDADHSPSTKATTSESDRTLVEALRQLRKTCCVNHHLAVRPATYLDCRKYYFRTLVYGVLRPNDGNFRRHTTSTGENCPFLSRSLQHPLPGKIEVHIRCRDHSPVGTRWIKRPRITEHPSSGSVGSKSQDYAGCGERTSPHGRTSIFNLTVLFFASSIVRKTMEAISTAIETKKRAGHQNIFQKLLRRKKEIGQIRHIKNLTGGRSGTGTIGRLKPCCYFEISSHVTGANLSRVSVASRYSVQGLPPRRKKAHRGRKF